LKLREYTWRITFPDVKVSNRIEFEYEYEAQTPNYMASPSA